MRFSALDWSDIAGTRLLPKRYVDRVHVAGGTQLGELCEIASGLYVDGYVSRDHPGAVPYLRVNNVRALVPNLTPHDVAYVVPAPDWDERVCVSTGDVVIARTGTLGKAFVVPVDLHGSVMSQHVTRLRLREPSAAGGQVLAAYLNSPQWKAQIQSVATGSTRLELTHGDLRRLQIPPLLPAASAGLKLEPGLGGTDSDLREVMTASESAVIACNCLLGPSLPPQRTFELHYDQKALVGSFSPRFHRPSSSYLEAELSRKYRCVRLGEIALIRRGAGSLAAEYEDDGIPYIRTSSIINYGIEFFPDHYGSDDTYKAHGQNVGPGDILLTIEGKIGEVALLGSRERCLIKNHIEVVRIVETAPVPKEFVYAFLLCRIGQSQIERRTVVQATIPGMGPASREILIPVAGMDTAAQRLLTETLDSVVDHVQRASQARTRLRRRIEALVRMVNVPGEPQPF